MIESASPVSIYRDERVVVEIFWFDKECGGGYYIAGKYKKTKETRRKWLTS
jgi:hypothetical protein